VKPRKFEITVKATQQAFGRINVESLQEDIFNALDYMLLENIKVEVKEIAEEPE
jgi:hypothetical protein